MKYKKLIILLPTIIIGCSSQVPPITNYSYDVYQYRLDNKDFAKLQTQLKSDKQNPDLIILNDETYWKLISKLDEESFFSVYKYSNISCKIVESSILLAQDSNDDIPCSYSYTNTQHSLNLQLIANKYKNNRISYTLSIQNESESKYQKDYDSSKEHFLFMYKTVTENLFFLIYRNELSIPWNTYKNSPQQQMAN